MHSVASNLQRFGPDKGAFMSSQHFKLLAVLFFAALLVLPGRKMNAQAITGMLVGTVRDATGAVVVGTQVTATNIETNVRNATLSGSAGDYTIPNVPPV